MPLDTYFRFFLALVFVLALIGACAWAAKRFGLANRVGKSGFGARGRTARLGIVETMALDPRRKLMLVRRDGVEHLIVLGPTGETLVESGIAAPQETMTLPAPLSGVAS
ncbi:MAG TPA: flagellar biosynthetic protein FliO [Alphaproteobacteria bacterium]|jgi:flagellar protein FliO/FliZ